MSHPLGVGEHLPYFGSGLDSASFLERSIECGFGSLIAHFADEFFESVMLLQVSRKHERQHGNAHLIRQLSPDRDHDACSMRA